MKHPYYSCFNRACPEKGKSIRRDQIEGDFAALLEELTPGTTLFGLVRSLFKHGWDQRLAQAQDFARRFTRDIQTLEKQIDALLERIVEASSPSVIAAYETKIAKLEREKLVLGEKRLQAGQSRRRFEDMFELAMGFLANPSKLWVSGSHAHRRLVLKLTFADRLSYCRKSGFRTPETTLPFKALGSFREDENAMAERMSAKNKKISFIFRYFYKNWANFAPTFAPTRRGSTSKLRLNLGHPKAEKIVSIANSPDLLSYDAVNAFAIVMP